LTSCRSYTRAKAFTPSPSLLCLFNTGFIFNLSLSLSLASEPSLFQYQESCRDIETGKRWTDRQRDRHLRLREVRGTRLRTTLTAPIDSSPNLLLFIVNVVREVFSDSDIERASIW
jgi:hypothetical protein